MATFCSTVNAVMSSRVNWNMRNHNTGSRLLRMGAYAYFSRVSLSAAVASQAFPPRSVSCASLDDEAWSVFATSYWERRPLVIEQFAGPALPLDGRSLFAAMCMLAANCPAERRERWIQIYVDGVRKPNEHIEELLPTPHDESLEGYDVRVCRAVGGREYLVRMEKLHVFYGPYWDVAFRFLGSLFRHVGIPPGADTAVFMGRYRRTPSGVHVDNLSSFNFPIVGRKGLRVWPRAYVKRNPTLVGATAYEAHLDASQLLEAEPGGLVYWPSSAFHIGEGGGAFSATLGIGVWIDKQPLGMVLELLGQLVHDADPAAAALVRTYAVEPDQRNVERLPEPVQSAVMRIEQLVASGALRTAATRHWLETLTSNSLKAAPVRDLGSPSGVAIAAFAGHPLITSTSDDGSVLVACRGQVVALPASCLPAIAELNAGSVSIEHTNESVRALLAAGMVHVIGS